MRISLLCFIGFLMFPNVSPAQIKESPLIQFEKKEGENPISSNPGEIKAHGTFLIPPTNQYRFDKVTVKGK